MKHLLIATLALCAMVGTSLFAQQAPGGGRGNQPPFVRQIEQVKGDLYKVVSGPGVGPAADVGTLTASVVRGVDGASRSGGVTGKMAVAGGDAAVLTVGALVVGTVT